MAEIEFGNFLPDRAGSGLFRVHLKFHFLCHYRLICFVRTEKTRNRAKVPARADQQARLYLAVDNPLITSTLNTVDGNAFTYVCAGTPQQVFIKLAAANAITDRLTIRNIHLAHCLSLRLEWNTTDAKAGNGLEGASARVIFRINFQRLKHKRRDPAAAYFVARKFGFVQDDNAQPGRTQTPGAG